MKLGNVTVLPSASILSPVILVCLYLGLGQAGINYILLSMLSICQCIKPLLWLQLVPEVVVFLFPGRSTVWHSGIQRYLLKAALTYKVLQERGCVFLWANKCNLSFI